VPALQQQSDPGCHLNCVTPSVCDVPEGMKVNRTTSLPRAVCRYGRFEVRLARKSNDTTHDIAESTKVLERSRPRSGLFSTTRWIDNV
jgi:hypothetical protein